jgi:small conductance mechanosensitive channel
MRQALHKRRRRLWGRISALFSLLLVFSLWLHGIGGPSAQAIVLSDPGREPVEAVQPGDAEALPATGSYQLASVRILGVPAIRVTSPTLALGRGSIDARRRARVIEGNLRMLYRPPQLCSVGERVADT